MGMQRDLGMVVGTKQLRALQRNGAITERGSFRAAGDDADVLGHSSRFSDADQSAFDCSWRGRVRAGVPISLLELFAGADSLYVSDAIDGQAAIEVVDFMLQEFGKIAVVSGV